MQLFIVSNSRGHQRAEEPLPLNQTGSLSIGKCLNVTVTCTNAKLSVGENGETLGVELRIGPVCSESIPTVSTSVRNTMACPKCNASPSKDPKKNVRFQILFTSDWHSYP